MCLSHRLLPMTHLPATEELFRADAYLQSCEATVLAVTEAGIASLGLWVQVPHYISAMSFPAASISLLRGVREITGVTIDDAELEREAMTQRNRIEQLVNGNDDHQAMVRQLENLYDQAEADSAEMDRAINELPSGDELAAEFERFLRDQGE